MIKLLFTMFLSIGLLFGSTAEAQTREISIDGDHGKLAAIIQTPDNRSKYPLVIICHGFTSNKATPLMTKIAEFLEKDGIASIRFDFNGHGQSEGNFQDMTVLNEISDAKHVFEYARQLPNVTSISIAGHSQGGVVTAMTAGELGKKNIKAVVLLAPAAVLRDDAIRGNLFGVKFDALNPPPYVEVFGNHKVGRNYFLTARDLPIYETAAGYKGAACIIHGTGDVVVPYTYGARFHDIWKNSEFLLLPNVDHSFTQDTEEAAKLAADFFAKQLIK